MKYRVIITWWFVVLFAISLVFFSEWGSLLVLIIDTHFFLFNAGTDPYIVSGIPSSEIGAVIVSIYCCQYSLLVSDCLMTSSLDLSDWPSSKW